MTGSSNQEPIIQNYIQQWKKMGLNVKLTGGRLIEFNSFYDKIQNDDPSVDMFIGAWSLSREPTPNDLYGEKSPMNYSRFVTKKNTQLLDEMDSQKAFNHKYRIDKFHEWQKYMDDEAYVLPVSNNYEITVVNKKLSGYSLKPSVMASLTGTTLLTLSKSRLKDEKSLLILEVAFLHSKYSTKTGII